ncbi:hypothetical protein K0M31_003430 [Melipona bicolor]|uniref:Uncharacterized protein n=1 Tax=Melipona bicolor TaxID=60889 RepID=A0AA40FZV3_9HYME|nr:hypothetical protein K0M31_003430 [Melipona bicolor]
MTEGRNREGIWGNDEDETRSKRDKDANTDGSNDGREMKIMLAEENGRDVREIVIDDMVHGTNCARERETGSRGLSSNTSLNRYRTDEDDDDNRLRRERHVGSHWPAAAFFVRSPAGVSVTLSR